MQFPQLGVLNSQSHGECVSSCQLTSKCPPFSPPPGQRSQVAAVATLQDDPQAVAARDLMRLGKMPNVAQIKAEDKFDLAAYLQKVTTIATDADAAATKA